MGIGENGGMPISPSPSNSLHFVGAFVAKIAFLLSASQYFTNPALGIDLELLNSHLPIGAGRDIIGKMAGSFRQGRC
jgi:hypothetical protein